MERRPAIASDNKTVGHRLYSHSQHPAAAKIQFRDVLDANAADLRPTFDRLAEDYRSGLAAQRAWDEQLDRVRARPGLRWLPEEEEPALLGQQERLRAARAAEADAEIILRTMDDLLSSVVTAYTGKDKPLDLGPALVAEVSVDRLLDAVGNYVRHRPEWELTMLERGAFTKQQLDSIRPLARVLTGHADIDGIEAYKALIEEPMPSLRVLDLLSGYTNGQGRGSYEHLEAMVAETASRIIDEKFTAWWIGTGKGSRPRTKRPNERTGLAFHN